ncbi:caspase family protein [Treponema primitia]|uniref:caspase family protein n=1 Tax=Treponema primitia TaxID=88058 RepID=UPI00397F4A2A
MNVKKSAAVKYAALLLILMLPLLGSCAGQNNLNRRGLSVEQKTDVEVFPQTGHSDRVQALAYSPDGSRIVSASRDTALKVWDTGSGRELRTLSGHTKEVFSVVYSPDGKRIVSGSDDNTLKIWDAESGRELRTLTSHALGVNAAAWSPDGKYLVSGSRDHTIKIWDALTGQELRTLGDFGRSGVVQALAWSPDGKRIVSGSLNKTVKVWDTASGLLRTLSGHTGEVYFTAYSPDGSRIISGSDRDVKIWDAETGRELRTIAASGRGYSADGKRIFSSSGSVYDIESGRNLMNLSGIGAYSVTVNSDGTRLLFGSVKDISEWDAATGRKLRELSGHTEGVSSAAYSPDGKRIASANAEFIGRDHSIKIWDLEGGREILSLTGHTGGVNAIAWSPDGKRIVSGSADRTIRVWDAQTGQELGTLARGVLPVDRAAYSPDGKRIISEIDGYIKIWDAESGKELLSFAGHTQGVKSFSYRSDGKRFVTGSGENTIKIWDAQTGRELRSLVGKSSMATESAVYSPDGKRIISGAWNGIRVWDAETGQELRTLSGHTNLILSLAYGPDSKRIVSGSADNTIRVWDAENGTELLDITGNTGEINSVSFSSDGKRLLSGSADGTTRIWDDATGKEVVRFLSFPDDEEFIAASRGLTVEMPEQSAQDHEWICITPEGYFNASPRGGAYLNVRSGNNVYSIDQFRSTFYKPEAVAANIAGKPYKADLTIQDAASILPPTVTIQSPLAGSSVTAGIANLSVTISDRNRPIQSIKILVNGTLLGRDELSAVTGDNGLVAEKASLSVTGGRKSLNFQVPVNLYPGRNIIEVAAFNGNSDTMKITEITWQTQAGQQIALPNLWILAVGVNQYDNADSRPGGLKNLNFCVNDAREIINSFKSQEGKRYGRVNSLLIADDSAVTPTAGNIRSNLQFFSGAGPRDVILFFLAGHGISDRTGRFFFLPRDAAFNADGSINSDSAISTDDIVSVLGEPGNRLVFIDACQSGGVDSNQLISSLMNSNAFVFSASKADEYSNEDAAWQHGAFTYSIISELQGAGSARSIGSLGMLQLSSFVTNGVVRLTNDRNKYWPQHPKAYYQGYHDFPVAEIR